MGRETAGMEGDWLERGAAGYRSDEAVSDAGDGFDVARGVGRVAERVAKFLNGFIEGVIEVDEDVGGPEALTEMLAGDDVAGGFNENGQELKRLLRQPDPGSVSGESRRLEVELEEAEADRLLGWRNGHSAPPYIRENSSLALREDRWIAVFHAWDGDKIF